MLATCLVLGQIITACPVVALDIPTYRIEQQFGQQMDTGIILRPDFFVQPTPPPLPVERDMAKRPPQKKTKPNLPKVKPPLPKVMTTDSSKPIVMAYASPAPLKKSWFSKAEPKGKAQLVAVHDAVDMRCFNKNKQLTTALNKIGAHYGKPVRVTSGYRSKKYNAGVKGAKHSAHMSCAAADIAVDGVSKESLRKYVRTLPEVGGVGIYKMPYIHIDTGRVRNWDWR